MTGVRLALTSLLVYNLSVLSNIPLSLSNMLPEQSPTQRLRPLFSIGVHDVPFLVEDYEASKRREQGEGVIDDDEAGSGWIACTTDSILAMKDTLWDMLITMPPEHSTNAVEKVWPVVECPRGNPVKATQRDVRRFNSLRNGLARLAVSSAAPDSPTSDTEGPRVSTSYSNRPITQGADDSFDKVTEPPTWAALAYNGYMWWASAGEQLRAEEQEESSRDAALLADLTPSPYTQMSMPQSATRSEPLADSLASLATRRTSATDDEARVELAIIAYFHRLTTQMLSVLAELVEGTDEAYPDDDEEEDEQDDEPADADENEALLSEDDTADAAATRVGRAVTVDVRSVENMGLDVWSAADSTFVQELLRTYFARTARIEGKGVEVCGVRVC